MATSFLENLVADIRLAIDDPDVGEKYSAAEILRQSGLAMRRVYKDLTGISDRPFVTTLDVSVVAGTKTYALPPCIGNVIQMGKWNDANGQWDFRVDPITRRHPYLPSVHLVGNRLVFDYAPTNAETIRIQYIPSGDFLAHEAKGTTGTPAETTTFRGINKADEATKLVLGSIDDRANAYVGGLLRVWEETPGGSSPAIIREGMVTSYTLATSTPNRVFGVDLAWSPVLANATEYRYEIVPFGFEGVRQLIVLGAAMTLCAMSGLTSRYQALTLEYRSAIRTERLAEAYLTPWGQTMPTVSYRNNRGR